MMGRFTATQIRNRKQPGRYNDGELLLEARSLTRKITWLRKGSRTFTMGSSNSRSGPAI